MVDMTLAPWGRDPELESGINHHLIFLEHQADASGICIMTLFLEIGVLSPYLSLSIGVTEGKPCCPSGPQREAG